jgi:hypothetical protein
VKVAIALLLTLASLSAARGVSDPVQNYLSNFSPLDGDKTIYSNDTLLRLELDLDGDGQYEVLLSMARDQDGEKGNVWSVYVNTTEGYTGIGTMTFSPRGFYLGPIDDLGDYGLVTFKPAGGVEGMLSAYLFDGVAVREIQIASVTRDPQSGELRGQAMVDKYLSQATDGADPLTSTNAATLAKQYGLRIAGDQQTQSSPFSAPSSPDSSASSGPVQSSSPSSKAEASRLIPWTVLIVILALVTVGAVVWVKRG